MKKIHLHKINYPVNFFSMMSLHNYFVNLYNKCNLELTAAIPQEPEALVLLRNILKEYSVLSKHSFKKTVYISNSNNNIFLKEPFLIDAEHFSSEFHNMHLSNVNTVVLGELDKLNKTSQKIIKQKINEFRGNVLVLP